MSDLLFASQEWIDRVWSELRSSENVRSHGATWCHGPIGLMVTASPDRGFAQDVLMRIDVHKGDVRDARIVEPAQVQLIPTVFGGSLARWEGLTGSEGSGSLMENVRRAFMSFRGDLPTATRHASLLDAIVSAARAVPTTFDAPATAAAPSPEAEHAGSAS
jgi:hypothetical protein